MEAEIAALAQAIAFNSHISKVRDAVEELVSAIKEEVRRDLMSNAFVCDDGIGFR